MLASIEKTGKYVLVKLDGELDLYSAHEFKLQMKQLIIDMGDVQDRRLVIFDFEKLSHIDSAGLGTFIDLKNLFIRRAIPYAFISIRGNTMKLVQFTNLTKFFPIYEKFEDALFALGLDAVENKTNGAES